MYLRVILIVLLAVPVPFAHSSNILSDVGDVISFVHDIVTKILEVWKLVRPQLGVEGSEVTDGSTGKDIENDMIKNVFERIEQFDLSNITDKKDMVSKIVEGLQTVAQPIINIINGKEDKLLKEITAVNRRLEHVDKVIQSAALSSLSSLKQDFSSQIRLELRLDNLLDLISTINFNYRMFKEYTNVSSFEDTTNITNGSERPYLERFTLENFATHIVSHSPSSVQGVLDRLHAMIHPDSDQRQSFLNSGLFKLLRHVLQDGENARCHVQQSPHQIIYNLYNSLQMTQLKGYTMMQFSWMLLRLYNKGNFTLESQLLQKRHINRLAEQAISLQKALQEADSAHWRCDPKQQVQGDTYMQLTRLLQGYIQNEVDLSPKGSCWGSCADYQGKSKQHGCFKNKFCARQRSCNGDIVDCRFIDSDMWVCQADPTLSTRRYDYIEYENGKLLGKKRQCNRVSKVDSWWRWVFWHCSYCFCICDDATNSDRYFSLRSVLSSTANNRVITGVRFVKMNGIIHIQIQEGSLGTYGRIMESSTTWKPVDNFRTKDANEGKDYMKMSFTKRALDLDDLKAPPRHVITGIKFRMVGSHLNLEIRATPFNFSSGELLEPGLKDQWLSSDSTDGSRIKPRTKLVLQSPDNPLKSLAPSSVDSKDNMYVEFTHSDIDEDAAQLTVPFLDAQIVAPQPPVPLAGVGVYHKGAKLFGGFIGLKVFTYDFGEHIEESLSNLKDDDAEATYLDVDATYKSS